jgi:Xaa-Pro aminopeptidase
LRRQARLAEIDLPNFGTPEAMPEIPQATYQSRIEALKARAAERGYEVIVVYADREHSANLSFLTGFDPRFEEAMLLVGAAAKPLLLVGNECVGMAQEAPAELRVELFQGFSLPGQPRDRSRELADILAEEGTAGARKVGAIGWKESSDRHQMELPAFLVDELRDAVGPEGVVENAGDLLTGAEDGLRVINDVDQLAVFEWAACQTSNGVRNLLFGVRPGMTEHEAVRLLEWNGSPLSCHLMLTAGDRARLGLLSPSDRLIERGDQFTVAFGIWGALNCRAGFMVENAGELDPA